MNMDEFKCSIDECQQIADIECTCKNKNMHCFEHYDTHTSSSLCEIKYYQEDLLLKKVLLVKNAFKSIYSKMITLSLAEIGKINVFSRENYNLIGHKKFRIKNSIDKAENPDYAITFAREHNIKSRDKSYFILNIQYLISINGESEKIKNEWTGVNQLLIDIERMKNIYIEKLKNQLIQLKSKIKIFDNKQYMEKQLLYANTKCNLESAKFEEMNEKKKIEYLVQQEYEDIEKLFVMQKELYEAVKISMTNRNEYIFICKF